jgi:hypothetical protein
MTSARTTLAMLTLSLTLVLATEATAKKAPEKKASRTLYSYSSVHPYIVHALRGCHCHWIDDEFEQRDCKKRCVPFKKKMLAWAGKNPVLHHDLELSVEKYNFKSRAYVLKREDVAMDPDSVPGSVIIGKGRCDSLTGMPMTAQRIVAKLKEKEAKLSVLRGAKNVSATAVLKGKVSTMNWCCDSYSRRDAAMSGVSCNGRVFKYTIEEVAIGDLPEPPEPVSPDDAEESDGDSEGVEEAQDEAPRPWRMGFKSFIESVDFEPSLIGFEQIPGELDD